MTLIRSAKTLVKPRCHRLLHTQSALRSHIDPLFCYTSGRWLWNERAQLEARYRYFDISGLQQAACQAVGASKCVSLEKIGEGNYNKVYRLEMDDGQKAVARIPHPNAGPRSLTTASEVATMEFARTVLHIPVPRVLAWSNNEQNSVKAEYIIMEEARGSQLDEVWESLSLRDKCQLICEFVDIEKRLLSVSFENNIPGCQPAAVQSGPQDVLDHIESTYCIGPITRREFWQKQRSTMQYHGPWASATEYLQSVACREIEWINTYAKLQEPNATPWQYTSPQQQSPEAHTALLHKFLAAVPHITPRDVELASPRLWHPDFHAGNIYVDNGHISCIIDWQGAWTAPVFIGANPPLLLDYGIDMLMELPPNLKDLDKDTQARLRYQVSQSILIDTYERRTARINPLMDKTMRYRHGQTLKQLEAFVGATWDNCLFPFEECLMRVQREWHHFGADGPCPFAFSAEETRRHDDEAESFNKSQAFWKALQGVLTDEGYTTHESFGTAVAVLKDLREGGLGELAGEERRCFDEETRWVAALDT
ncbi:kinase-like domain-containing protein [Boeremia exigua]|uniref:kinase-like domain-containing protein n=1 Tax=Boeremia exigua TaxID=749465 RepID=UPI001E8D037D|nr:kinase-like domain-containing protein [Boeremia exigua]KAH6633274.1 kinase-like domain-containing protein [Boeremia exigua]